LPEDGDRIKRLVEFRKKLETKIEQLNTELKDLQVTLEAVNSILLDKSFKHPQIPENPQPEYSPPTETVNEPEPSHEDQEGLVLKTGSGEILAKMYGDEDQLKIVPVEDKEFNFNTPPFKHFLLERILLRMQERDNELARTGQLPVDSILCYNIVREGDKIREIVINNVGRERLKELRSSVRWTLEKMYEKTKTQT